MFPVASSGTVFIFSEKSCGSPGDVKNGVFDFSQGVEFGATVVATCNTGSVMSFVLCERMGVWVYMY